MGVYDTTAENVRIDHRLKNDRLSGCGAILAHVLVLSGSASTILQVAEHVAEYDGVNGKTNGQFSGLCFRD